MDEDEDDGLEQKEAMSKQMTELLLERVKKLGGTISAYREALDDDVNTQASSTYAGRTMLLEKKQSIRNPVNDVNSSNFRNSTINPKVSFGASDYFVSHSKPSRQAMDVSIFDSYKEGKFVNVKKSKGDNVKESMKKKSRKSTRRQTAKAMSFRGKGAEHFLQKIFDNNVTRSIEVLFQSHKLDKPNDDEEEDIPETKTGTKGDNLTNEGNFDIKVDLLLRFTLEKIQLPDNENIESTFKKVVSFQTVKTISEMLFWFTCRSHFSPAVRAIEMEAGLSEKKKERIRNRIHEKEIEKIKPELSEIYVCLLRQLQKVKSTSKRDVVHKYLPYAVAHTIISGFKYFCPASRHLYTGDLKHKVYYDCCMLLGVENCSSTVSKISTLLFPKDVELRDHRTRITGGLEVSKRSDAVDVDLSASLAQSLSKFQPRIKFNAKKVGPLMNTYLGQTHTQNTEEAYVKMERSDINVEDRSDDEDSCAVLKRMDVPRPHTSPSRNSENRTPFEKTYAPTRTHYITRTIPSAMCQNGGTETFRRSQSRASIAKQIAEKHRSLTKEHDESVRKSRILLHETSLTVSSKRDSVLRGGMAHVGRFCLDLVQARSSKTTKFKRTVDKLDWHSNLEANGEIIQLADRIVAVKDGIDEARKKERRKPRTKARMMLLHMNND